MENDFSVALETAPGTGAFTPAFPGGDDFYLGAENDQRVGVALFLSDPNRVDRWFGLPYNTHN
jgi:hypothetical protein